jgi:thiamine pyrophosphokinase
MRVILALNRSIALRVESLQGATTVCADGAARAFLAHGVLPNLVVGDFDSLTPAELDALERGGSRIVRHPAEKDETDGELALDAALGLKPTTLEILGLDGGRADMMYFNLSLLRDPRLEKIPTTCVFCDQSRGYLVTASSAVELETPIGTTLSLLPLLDSVSVTELSGVRWPLENQEISSASARTVSNRVTGPVKCVLQTGRALLIVGC